MEAKYVKICQIRVFLIRLKFGNFGNLEAIETLRNVWVGPESYGVHRIYSIGQPHQPQESSALDVQLLPKRSSNAPCIDILADGTGAPENYRKSNKDEIRMKVPKRCSENGTNFILHSANLEVSWTTQHHLSYISH